MVQLQPPASLGELAAKIVHFGHFKTSLDFMVNLMRSTNSSALILRGNEGTGKKTLIREAQALSNVICIYLNPYHLTDDYSALKQIAVELGMTVKSSIQELLADIEERNGTTLEKIVIVLDNFEEFCRDKQGLLYNLTNLAQHGRDISLIGLTLSLDCTESLEKRVRSRLNTLFHCLRLPYSNKEEYVQFASLLLGGYKIGDKLRMQLEYMYSMSDQQMRVLKRYLMTLCSWDAQGVLTVKQPTESRPYNPESDMPLLAERFGFLTRPQQELFKMAAFHCFEKETSVFNLEDLDDCARRHQHLNLGATSLRGIKDAAILTKLSFFEQCHPDQIITHKSLLAIGNTASQFKEMMSKNPEFHWMKTDVLWKRLR